MSLTQDFLQKHIITNGFYETVKTILYDKNYSYIFQDRKKQLCEIALYKLGYNVYKFKQIDIDYDCIKILYKLLDITNRDYDFIKNHDELLKLCLIKHKTHLVNFILDSHNHFESILMLILGINKEINKYHFDIILVSKYLKKLIEYKVDYLPEIEKKINYYAFLQIKLYL